MSSRLTSRDEIDDGPEVGVGVELGWICGLDCGAGTFSFFNARLSSACFADVAMEYGGGSLDAFSLFEIVIIVGATVVVAPAPARLDVTVTLFIRAAFESACVFAVCSMEALISAFAFVVTGADEFVRTGVVVVVDDDIVAVAAVIVVGCAIAAVVIVVANEAVALDDNSSLFTVATDAVGFEMNDVSRDSI